MSAHPRVSVVMASYNHADFVAQAVESALSQSFGDLELVITDDGSSDKTVDIIKSFRDPRIHLEAFPRNRGACDATNHAIGRARGKYIAILNSDDFFLPGKIEKQVALLDCEPGIGAVFGLPRLVDQHGGAVDSSPNPYKGLFTAQPADRFEWLAHFFFRGNAICHPTALIRREVFERVGLYDPMLRQLPDFDMWIRICSKFEIRVLNQELTAFRVLPAGQNTSGWSQSSVRRTSWEDFRVLSRFLEIDEDVLRTAFRRHFPLDQIGRGIPAQAMLAHLAIRQDAPFRQAFGLLVLEELVCRGVAGISISDWHAITGELNPFRVGWRPDPVPDVLARKEQWPGVKNFIRRLIRR
jgi:glycosyltransferase involved in cell wall biosynthesis